jgi:hypothetical protein
VVVQVDLVLLIQSLVRALLMQAAEVVALGQEAMSAQVEVAVVVLVLDVVLLLQQEQ